MRKLLLTVCLLLPTAAYLATPAVSQPQDSDAVYDSGSEVIIAGTVTGASDSDGDGKNDTFVINTGGTNTKTVKNTTETKDMGLIQVDDKVEIKVSVEGDGLKIVDVIKIGG